MSLAHLSFPDSGVVPEEPIGMPIHDRPLHRLAEIRRRQGVTRRTIARRLNTDIGTIKSQEQPDADLRLSILYAWQEVLDVPVSELLVETEEPLSTPVLKRAQLVRIMKTAAAILRHHLDVFVDYSEEIVEFEEAERKVDEERDRLRKILNMSVNEIELSVRAANCLNNANITSVGELASKTEADMLKYRNFGKKSLNEIKEKLVEMGLCLGFKFDADLLESRPEPPPAAE